MRVLAFDPGYERLGVAVLEKEKLLFSDCLRTSATLPFPDRLAQLGKAVKALITEWRPDAVALEEVYFKNNAKTAMQVAEVRGMLTYLAATKNLPVHQYTPLQVKVAVTGNGRADKGAVGMMVHTLLGLSHLTALGASKKLDDETDAIAVGITCLASLR